MKTLMIGLISLWSIGADACTIFTAIHPNYFSCSGSYFNRKITEAGFTLTDDSTLADAEIGAVHLSEQNEKSLIQRQYLSLLDHRAGGVELLRVLQDETQEKIRESRPSRSEGRNQQQQQQQQQQQSSGRERRDERCKEKEYNRAQEALNAILVKLKQNCQ